MPYNYGDENLRRGRRDTYGGYNPLYERLRGYGGGEVSIEGAGRRPVPFSAQQAVLPTTQVTQPNLNVSPATQITQPGLNVQPYVPISQWATQPGAVTGYNVRPTAPMPRPVQFAQRPDAPYGMGNPFYQALAGFSSFRSQMPAMVRALRR